MKKTRPLLCSVLVMLLYAHVVHGGEDWPNADSRSTVMSLINKDTLEQILLNPASVVLIDARSAEEFEQAHISGAVNLAIDDVHQASLLPENKNAPIVIYSATGLRATNLASELRSRRYSNVEVLPPEQIQLFEKHAVFNCNVDMESTQH